MVRRQQRLSALQVAKLSKPGLARRRWRLDAADYHHRCKVLAASLHGGRQAVRHGAGADAYREPGRGSPEGSGRAEAAYRGHQPFGGQEAEPYRRRTGQCQDDDVRPVRRGVYPGAQGRLEKRQACRPMDKHTQHLRQSGVRPFARGRDRHRPGREMPSPIWESKTETASRLRGRIESVLGWASTSGYRTGENPARWKGHLDNLLATISKSSRTKHHPSLPWQRIGAFMSALRAREGVSARAVEFAILTACRSGEVRGAKWTEFDTAGKVWTIPAERMKAKREHEVPLSDAALALLESMPKVGEIVFAGTKKQLLSDMSLTAVIRRMNGDDKPVWADANGEGVTVHGFRSSFRMWAAETTNYPREVAEHALAHQLPDAVERAYQRGSQFAKRAALMAEWSVYCATVQTDAVVKPIRGATQR
jgi:integrase